MSPEDDQPGADTPMMAALDRRAWVRYPVDLNSSCQPAQSADPAQRWSATICDLSAGGLRLRINRPLDRGLLLRIELPSNKRRAVNMLLARIVHATQTEDGEWLVGCAFPSPLREEDVRALIA